MIPKINVSDIRGSKLKGNPYSYQVTMDGEIIGIFIQPQTDYIKQTALNLVELSNSICPPMENEDAGRSEKEREQVSA